MDTPEITQDFLKEWLDYDPTTGVFMWLPRSRSVRKIQKAGCLMNSGYAAIRFKGKLYLSHRLAWFYMTGLWPESQLDHKDGCRTNNAWSNLRQATPSENSMNKIAKGYHKHTRNGREGFWFSAYIEKDGKTYRNTFRTEEKAKAWRQVKEIELFGDFRREIV